MKVRRPIFTVFAVVLTLPVAWFTADRITFVRSAQTVTGTIGEVYGYTDNCAMEGRRGPSRPKPCTRFDARVDYLVNGKTYDFRLRAGTKSGRNQPVCWAVYRRGEPVPIIYDPSSPDHAYRNTFWAVWGAPVVMFFVQLISLVSGFRERRPEG